MAKRVQITLPDDDWNEVDADYIREVADQVSVGYLSGHHGTDHHWTIERD